MGKSMQRMFTTTLDIYAHNISWINQDKATSRWDVIVSYIADLIDRPTCHISETDHEFEDSVRCDRCQMTFNRPWEPFKFCPNCGAEVMD